MYIVLSDDSTYDSEKGCHVVLLNAAGEGEMDAGGDYKHVSECNVIKKISISDLIKAYSYMNSTKL